MKRYLTQFFLMAMTVTGAAMVFQNCSEQLPPTADTNGGSGGPYTPGPSGPNPGPVPVTPTPGPTGPPAPGPLVIHDDFESWFPGGACTNPSNLSDCVGVAGSGNGKSLYLRKFGSTCTPFSVTSWVGGSTQFHGGANGNPGPASNMQWIRFQGSANEILSSRNPQSTLMGGIAVDFLAEGTPTQTFEMVTHMSLSKLPSCEIYDPSSARGYLIGYSPNWPGKGAGFAVYIMAPGPYGVVASSFIPYTMVNKWHNIWFGRNTNGYQLAVRVWDGSKFTLIASGEKTIPVSEMLVGGAELPLGYVGINSDTSSLVNFDNFNVEW